MVSREKIPDEVMASLRPGPYQAHLDANPSKKHDKSGI